MTAAAAARTTDDASATSAVDGSINSSTIAAAHA